MYPLILLASTLPTAPAVAANDVRRMKVVDTGILSLVRIRRKIAAETCKKWKFVGAFSKPLAESLA